jgi:hypothetical protein
MAELRGDGLGRLDQCLIGSVEAPGAERLGKKRGHVGLNGRRDVRDRRVHDRLGWLDHLVDWLVQVMDQRSITWTQRSNRPTEPGAPPRAPPTRPTDPVPLVRPCASRLPTRPTPRHPPARSTSRRLASCPASSIPTDRPCAARPTPRCPPDLVPLHPPSHASPTDERLLLFCLAPPLPPPPNASPVVAPASSDHMPHKITEEIIKWLNKSQNG